MASFTAILEVGGKRYPLHRYEFSMHQETDTLGRPASPVLGGTITCTLSTPGAADPFLVQWMLSPTMQQDGKIRLMQAAPQATEKTISFFNAYCTQMSLNFQPGQNGGAGSSGMPSSLMQLVISSQRVAVGAITHDNNWPVASHGAGETFAKQQPPTPQQPSAISDMVHTALDVVGMIPILGEVADGTNALLYAAEGDHANAALSAASMIPGIGNAVGAAKLAKRGAKLLGKARGLAKLTNKANRLKGAAAAAVKRKAKKIVPSPSKLATQWQGVGDYPGIDKFRDITVKKGKIIYAGEPGASGFFLTKKSLDKAEGSAEKLWKGLQVKEHDKFGYRTKVGIFEVIEETTGAFGVAKANMKHGPGGLQQIYLPDMSKVKKIGEIVLN